jgi:hypothetical protein
MDLPTDELIHLVSAGASLDLRTGDWVRIARAMKGKPGARLKIKHSAPTAELISIAEARGGCVEFS